MLLLVYRFEEDESPDDITVSHRVLRPSLSVKALSAHSHLPAAAAAAASLGAVLRPWASTVVLESPSVSPGHRRNAVRWETRNP